MVRTLDILSAPILIVDDEEAHVLLLKRMLRGAGYTCIQSTMDPHEVCELDRQNHFAAILLDLKMPGMDGFKVMDELKEFETDFNLPVLVITAEPGEKLRALRAGARVFVSKPLVLAEVLMRLHDMIEDRLQHLEMKRFYSHVVEEYSEVTLDGTAARAT